MIINYYTTFTGCFSSRGHRGNYEREEKIMWLKKNLQKCKKRFV